MAQEKSRDLCKTCKHYWIDSPTPFNSAFHCNIMNNKFHRSKIMDDVISYPCTKCPFDCYIKK